MALIRRHVISLGLLVVEAHWPEPTRDMVGAKTTWSNIFRSADLDGNDYLTGADSSGVTGVAAPPGGAAASRAVGGAGVFGGASSPKSENPGDGGTGDGALCGAGRISRPADPLARRWT